MEGIADCVSGADVQVAVEPDNHQNDRQTDIEAPLATATAQSKPESPF